MKFPRIIFLTISVCLLTTFSFSQTTDSIYDPKAKTILDQVMKTMRADSTKTATFTITMKKADGTKDIKTGELIIKGNKYKIVLQKKIGDKIQKEEYYNDGRITAVYSESDNEVTYDNTPDPGMQRNQNSISSADIFTIFGKDFKYKFIKEDTLNGRAVQYVDLYPEQSEKKNYHTVHLLIDKEKKQIITVIFVYKDGSIITYNIDTFTPNLPAPDSTFQFDESAHPGVIITPH
jgi:outer membrane lipoprotein-sorting protein